MRTTLGTCTRKRRYTSEVDAMRAASKSALALHSYRCALCRDYHLTSRTKGMFVGRKSDKAAP